jgi:hypothetical protein
MRITAWAALSAFCSNLSPGALTTIFAWTAGAAGGKKSLPPALPKKGLDALLAVVEVDFGDFSAPDFIAPYRSPASLRGRSYLHSTHNRPSIQGNLIVAIPQGSWSIRMS